MSKRALIDALCAWFDREARDLPWRRKRTGYTALVSEAMLQQTQVSRVIDCYRRFIKAFPNVRALADADEQAVLAHWQGMGYYRRARNLHAAAGAIVREFGGRVPRDVERLLRLPGVGRYTAGAIASIGFGKAAPIVDGNVERVLMRISAHRCDAFGANPQAWVDAEALVRIAPRPGVFNEALMELGATVCLPAPKTPRCDVCPIAKWCQARKQGLQMAIPPAKRRADARLVHHHAVIVTRRGSETVLLEQRGDGGMWAGMWQTPTIESEVALSAQEIAARLACSTVNGLTPRGEFTHATTHRAIRFHVLAAESRSRRGSWRRIDDLDDLPMSNAQRKVLRFAKVGN